MPEQPTHNLQSDTKPNATLYVDMDGALCATDTLWESLIELVRHKPLELFKIPLWLLKGKAGFKRAIADVILPDIATLPVRAEVISVIERYKASGQRVVLATAADRRIASAVADRLGFFDDVLATDSATNLAANNKLSAIQNHAKGSVFDYLGDSKADLCILAQSQIGYVAGPKESVWKAVVKAKGGQEKLVRLKPTAGGIKPIIKALRPHQWAKNVLIGVPLVVSHQLTNLNVWWLTILAFWAFSLTASSVYIVNDLLDLTADRIHPSKHKRPFASGAVSIPVGIFMTFLLIGSGLGIAFGALGMEFGGMVLLYIATSTCYSTFLKRKLILDIIVLAGLYALRILTGAVAISVHPSEWLIAFSVFIFTSLAMLKRYAELKTWSKLNEKWPMGRRYTISDMDLLRSAGIAASYAAVLVFAIYISSQDVRILYRHHDILWMVCPIMLYWLTRMWFLTNRSKILDDPVLFALTDKASIACGGAVMALVFAAT